MIADDHPQHPRGFLWRKPHYMEKKKFEQWEIYGWTHIFSVKDDEADYPYFVIAVDPAGNCEFVIPHRPDILGNLKTEPTYPDWIKEVFDV